MAIHRFPIQLRFGDEDSNGHVNNVRYVQFLEEARVRLSLLPLPGAGADGGPQNFRSLTAQAGVTLVARQEIEYRTPLTYRQEPVWIEIWVTRIGGASLAYGFRLTDADAGGGTVFALAEADMVMVSRETGAPLALSARQREILEGWRDGPVPFRRAAAAAGAVN
ncbi:acyl-CoA thioesterase [Arthrobacter sp. Sa2BUA2]|uniref:Acyl-CoA thioesterase n=1 Tax=Arthrobacter pullicola TaxID=2762224 RepID=A0ABR8YH01_9MICC|nr:thioesterase family protein [Arthrobacter pullicola]MBD8043421.1 acyl-CoA thioesterase [Arthrobacter pullicola]